MLPLSPTSHSSYDKKKRNINSDMYLKYSLFKVCNKYKNFYDSMVDQITRVVQLQAVCQQFLTCDLTRQRGEVDTLMNYVCTGLVPFTEHGYAMLGLECCCAPVLSLPQSICILFMVGISISKGIGRINWENASRNTIIRPPLCSCFVTS